MSTCLLLLSAPWREEFTIFSMQQQSQYVATVYVNSSGSTIVLILELIA